MSLSGGTCPSVLNRKRVCAPPPFSLPRLLLHPPPDLSENLATCNPSKGTHILAQNPILRKPGVLNASPANNTPTHGYNSGRARIVRTGGHPRQTFLLHSRPKSGIMSPIPAPVLRHKQGMAARRGVGRYIADGSPGSVGRDALWLDDRSVCAIHGNNGIFRAPCQMQGLDLF
jgi:hypothetical protein